MHRVMSIATRVTPRTSQALLRLPPRANSQLLTSNYQFLSTTGAQTKPHSIGSPTKNCDGDYTMDHYVYTPAEVKSVEVTHLPVVTIRDRVAFTILNIVKTSFNFLTRYGHNMTTSKYLTRMVVLETVAGIPGMVGGMVRHLHSLRKMKRDGGYINTLLSEAENERMHLLTFLHMRKPSVALRGVVIFAQGLIFNLYFVAYLASPRTCHRFVGYLEEEAVRTYTKCIAAIEDGSLKEWQVESPPEFAKKYWHLAPNAKILDLMYAIRADEANHRDVNHCIADLTDSEKNPFVYESQGPTAPAAAAAKAAPAGPTPV